MQINNPTYSMLKHKSDLWGRLLALVLAASLWLAPHQLPGQPILLLYTQADVDAVLSDYPGIEEVSALVIGSLPNGTVLSNIHDLSPLASIRRVSADICVRNNPHLKSLTGLHNIDTIGGTFYTCIENNDSLVDLSGLSGAKLIGEEIHINDNERLESLAGLENIAHLHNVGISGNPSLASLNGLQNLERVTGYLYLAGNALKVLDLPNLRSINSLDIREEPLLRDLSGLTALDTLLSLGLFENPSLENTNGIEGAYIAGPTNTNGLWIQSNPVLTDIGSLSTCHGDTIRSIRIRGNGMLGGKFSLPNVRTVLRVIEIVDNPVLEEIDFPSLETIAGQSGGMLEITGNAGLTNIYLPNLRYAGSAIISGTGEVASILIENNGSLETLGALGKNLVLKGNLMVIENNALKSLSGLESLDSVKANFTVHSNDSLEKLCTFDRFGFVGGRLGIYLCPNLTTIDGLQTLKYVGIHVGVGVAPSLFDVSAIAEIDSIGWNLSPFESGGIGIGNCASLKSISTLSGINSIAPRGIIGISDCNMLDTVSFTAIKELARVVILNNSILSHLDFPSLTKIGTYQDSYRWITVKNNPNLVSIDGFSNIEEIRDSMEIRNNPLLSDCSAICHILEKGVPSSRFKLGGNAFPCNSVPEIKEHICDTLTAVFDPFRPAGYPPYWRSRTLPLASLCWTCPTAAPPSV